MIFSPVFCEGERRGRVREVRNILTGSTNDPGDINEAGDATDPGDDDALTNDTSLLSVDKKARNNRLECLKYDLRMWRVQRSTC